jgi:hypothetical protein
MGRTAGARNRPTCGGGGGGSAIAGESRANVEANGGDSA